ncbi:hypothetical protein Sipo8835_34450 [Streptomyces ipomoeae]|jgi:hypothetical protein|uniref:Uncharacterized protein n=2 Tax=Streptomyces ipomoeae TaxID=103232 RepID=L1L5L7_9ACTN|nr:hypothetical protein [Streptomyces ipomoeae]EKX68084.1 hypothetical protein STRIP9103_00076 [Streptomyces ipomoeae 91-03]MDX2697419.1 hypothetical protein [Streptomyces ipomoeae]MDX2828177.1 hypothetical protein [Streptomyces ipomoeae]MDX2843181.1 hypothetical protein [Streptomyces ipomoeae]MDX2880686.1 hypothetical protein [Streptomyces ipomoeae]
MYRTKLLALASAPALAIGLVSPVMAEVAAAPAMRQSAPAQTDPSSEGAKQWGPWVSIPAGAYRQASAYCPQGQTATGGGGRTEAGGTSKTYVVDTYPRGTRGWYTSWRNTGTASERVRAYARCAT